MTMPADVAFVQLAGTFLDGTGAGCNTDPTIGPVSQLIVSPMLPTRFSDIASNVAILPQRQVINLASGGIVPGGTQVIATDAAALAGISGFQYACAVILYDHLGAQLSPYSFLFYAPTGTGPIVLSSPQYAATGNSVGVPAM